MDLRLRAIDERLVERLASALRVRRATARCLVGRGVADPRDAQGFIDPRLCDAQQLVPVRPHDEDSDWFAFAVMVCRTLLQQLRPHGKVMYAASPLASGSDFERNVLDAFAIRSADEMPDRSVVIVDEAHTTPQAVIEVLRKLSATVSARGRSLSVIFAAQPSENNLSTKSIQAVDHLMATRSRLLPFGREECAGYVGHRLAVGGGTGISFSPSAIDVLFALSGGVPRLVNLLCERALREAAAAQCWRIEPSFVEMAATSLELLRAQPRRFRWFARPGRVGAVAQAGRGG